MRKFYDYVSFVFWCVLVLWATTMVFLNAIIPENAR